MADKNNIDDLFKKSLHNRDFSFNEKAWEKAEQLIEQEESDRKRVRLFWAIGGIAAIVAVVLSLFYFSENPSRKLASENNKQLEKESGMNEIKPAGEKENENISSGERDSYETVTEKDKDEVSASETQNKNSEVHEKEPAIVGLGGKERNSDDHQGIANDQEGKQKSLDDAHEEVAAPSKDEKADKKFGGRSAVDKMPSLMAWLKSHKKQNNLESRSSNDRGVPEWVKRTSVSLTGGVNISKGLKNTGVPGDPASLKPFGGIGVAYILNETFSVNINFLYRERSGLNSEITTSSNADYSVKKNTLSLHYLDIPVYFDYKIDMHSLLVGLQYSQILTEETESYYVGVSGKENVEKSWGKTNDFAGSDMGIMLGYEYMLTEMLNVGIRGHYGLMDMTDNLSFSNNSRDHNAELRIFIDYKIFNHRNRSLKRL